MNHNKSQPNKPGFNAYQSLPSRLNLRVEQTGLQNARLTILFKIEIAAEPVAGELRDLIERARLFKLMCRAVDDHQLFLAAQLFISLPVHVARFFILAADDQ